jgi:hypothetical protein
VPAAGEIRTGLGVELAAGTPARVELTLASLPGGGSASLLWRTKGMAKTAVPAARIYGQTQVADARASLLRIQKAAMFVRLLGLSADEARRVAAVDPSTRDVLNRLDANGTIAAADLHTQWKKVEWLIWLTATKRDRDIDSETLVQLLTRPDATTPQGRSVLAGAMGWSETDQAAALTRVGLTVADLAWLASLRRVATVLDLAATTLQPVADLITWSVPGPDAALVDDVKAKLKARMDAAAWRESVQSVNDALRNKRRDALVATILKHQPPDPEITTPDRLYEYFLVDPEMDACMQTSRIRLALSTVQLFVNRCLMNLEPKVSPASIRADHWQWMSRYRVWEANRKVFLYPENWLEPELRDNKSPMFRDLEAELLKADITTEAAEDAYLSYLKKLDDVSKLEIVGAYLQQQQPANPDDDILHVFGRTIGTTREYYYRRFEYGYWTPWEKVSLKIEGDLLLPVIWRSQLLVFWVTAVVKPMDGDRSKKPADMANQPWGTNARISVELTLNWGQYYRGKWTSPKSSEMKEPLRFVGLDSFDPSQLVLASHTDKPAENISERLVIGVVYLGHAGYTLTFTSKHAPPLVQGGLDARVLNDVDLFNYALFWADQDAARLDSNSLVLPDKSFEVRIAQPDGAPVGSRQETVLTKTAAMLDGFRVRPVMHPVENQWEAPFFYTDEHSVFFVSGEELLGSILVLDGYYDDFFEPIDKDRLREIPKLTEKPVIPKPGDPGPVIVPFENVINPNYRAVIANNSTFEFAGASFDARGRVEERLQ